MNTNTENQVSTYDLMEAACCIWEEMLNLVREYETGIPSDNVREGLAEQVDRAIQSKGYAAMRLIACDLAKPCHLAYEYAVEECGWDGPFDWEWTPRFLSECVDEHWNVRDDWSARVAEFTRQYMVQQ